MWETGLSGLCSHRGAPWADAALGARHLLERALNAGERRIQLRAEALHDGDDGDGNAGGDEAIFHGGRARFVLHEALH